MQLRLKMATLCAIYLLAVVGCVTTTTPPTAGSTTTTTPALPGVLPTDCAIDPTRVLNGYPRAITAGEETARSVPVLAYHGIEESGSEYSIPECDFKEHMFVLKRAGYETVSANDFVQFMEGRKQLPDKSFLLTFDDGLKSSYRFADPILEELDYTAVMFIITGRSLGPGGIRFLSVDEVLDMSKSGRWDIQDHSRDAHDPIIIDQHGSKGHFLSNKLWLQENQRLETDEEYRRRLRNQFLISKSDIGRVLGEEPVLYAFPFNDFGQGSSNMPEAEAYVLDEIRSVYPTGKFMFQINPNKGKFSHNHPDSTVFLIKRIRAAFHGGAHDLLTILEGGRLKALPSTDDFSQHHDWKTIWDNMSINDNLVITPADGVPSGGVFLDGSFLWEDYLFAAEVRSIGSRSVSIYGRYVDRGDYSACIISDNSIRIEERIDCQIRVVAKSHLENQDDDKRQIGISVRGREVECFVDGEVVVKAAGVNSNVPHGGIALVTNGLTGPNSRLVISKVMVEPTN